MDDLGSPKAGAEILAKCRVASPCNDAFWSTRPHPSRWHLKREFVCYLSRDGLSYRLFIVIGKSVRSLSPSAQIHPLTCAPDQKKVDEKEEKIHGTFLSSSAPCAAAYILFFISSYRGRYPDSQDLCVCMRCMP